MKKNVVLVLMVSSFILLGTNIAYANHHSAYKQQNLNTSKQVKRSKQKAMQVAERRSGGRAVAVKLTGDGQSYRVRVLLANGTVKHILVSAYE